MSNIKQLFEKELKNKLALKTSGHTSEETVLVKAFKYFDLDNSGQCSIDEFLKAITKIGITTFPSLTSNKFLSSTIPMAQVNWTIRNSSEEFSRTTQLTTKAETRKRTKQKQLLHQRKE